MNSIIHEVAWRSAIYCLFAGAVSFFSMLAIIRQIAQERQSRIKAEFTQYLRAERGDEEDDDPVDTLQAPRSKPKRQFFRYLLIPAHALVVVGSLWIGLPALTSAKYIHQGDAAYAAHDYEGAVKKYNIAMEANPTAAWLNTQSQNAIAQYDAGADGDLGTMRRMVTLHPGDDRNHNDLGNALMRRNDMAGALKEYRKAVELNPQSAISHNNLGNAYMAAHQNKEAIVEFRKAIELDPDQVPTYYNLANTLVAEQQLDEAIKDYRIAVRKNPKLSPAYYNLAQALGMQGKREEAARVMDSFIQVAPKQPEFAESVGKAKQQIAEWRNMPH